MSEEIILNKEQQEACDHGRGAVGSSCWCWFLVKRVLL